MEFSAPCDEVAGTPNCPRGPRDVLSNGKQSLRVLEGNTGQDPQPQGTSCPGSALQSKCPQAALTVTFPAGRTRSLAIFVEMQK